MTSTEYCVTIRRELWRYADGVDAEVFGALPNAHALRDRVLGYVKTAGIRLKKGNTFGDQVVIIAGDYCSMEAETFTQVVAGDVTHRIVANLRLFAYGAA